MIFSPFQGEKTQWTLNLFQAQCLFSRWENFTIIPDWLLCNRTQSEINAEWPESLHQADSRNLVGRNGDSMCSFRPILASCVEAYFLWFAVIPKVFKSVNIRLQWVETYLNWCLRNLSIINLGQISSSFQRRPINQRILTNRIFYFIHTILLMLKMAWILNTGYI